MCCLGEHAPRNTNQSINHHLIWRMRILFWFHFCKPRPAFGAIHYPGFSILYSPPINAHHLSATHSQKPQYLHRKSRSPWKGCILFLLFAFKSSSKLLICISLSWKTKHKSYLISYKVVVTYGKSLFFPRQTKSFTLWSLCVNSAVAIVYFLLYVCKHMLENLNVIALHIILP